MKKNGFTLVELMGVIVVLALIALISSPAIIKVIENSKKEALKDTATGMLDAADMALSAGQLGKGTITYPATYNVVGKRIEGEPKLSYHGTPPKSGSLTVYEDGTSTIAIYDGTYCATKTTNEKKVAVKKTTEKDCKVEEDKKSILNGADPVLGEGMIPVTIAGDGTVKKADASSQWYDYENKQWANAVLVSSDVRSTYQNGDAIPEEKILGYFVWIPRYKYKLFNTDNQGVPEQQIEVVFESKGTTKSKGSTNGTYLTHPAFTFGSKEVDGIWVGKFETTGSISNVCTNESCMTANLTVKPNSTSVRNQVVSSMFYATRSMSTASNNAYGLKASEINTHMMKNMEWGATAYLTQSKYGRCVDGTCTEVGINNNTSFLTGAGNYKANTTQSTTGNITGIYDMSGGAWEYVMGNMKDTSGNFYSSNAGFKGTSEPKNPETMYYDSYAYDTSYTSYGRGLLGDSTREILKILGSTSGGWYNDYVYFLDMSNSWFVRGGVYVSGVNAGVFYFSRTDGSSRSDSSWRIVINK
ncbi:MAG: type II secretion system protein [Bacilli bacterium]|nr:type II secretion system protein [Bacilli bacterium]